MQLHSPRPKRLLLIAYHFPPSGAVATFRMLGFARNLPRFGWEVGVLTPRTMPDEPVDEDLSVRVPAETLVFTTPFPTGRLINKARSLIGDSVWLPKALPALIRAVKQFQPDAVLTSGPPHCVHFLGMFLKRWYGLPWAMSFRDPWYINGPLTKKTSLLARWERFWEKRAVDEADCIIGNTPLGCRGLQQAFPRHKSKITFVTNGFDPELFPSPNGPISTHDGLTILHAGEIYMGRDPRPFFDAVQALTSGQGSRTLPMRIRLLGQSTESSFDLRSVLTERGLGDVVELGGQVPYAEALAAMAKADILLLLDTPGRKIGIPAKLFEYFGANRPVLALTEPDGDVAWALRAGGVPHRIANPLNTDQIRRAMVDLVNDLRHGRLMAPTSAQRDMFTRVTQAQQLARCLDAILPRELTINAFPRTGVQTTASANADSEMHAAPPARRPHYAGA